MKNRTLMMMGGGVCLLFALFSGCGENSGEKEYSKAMAAWERNDLVRAQSQLEKAIRKLSGDEKKSEANNQLGIILWQLGKQDQAIERFGESCRLADDLSGANLNLGIALYYAGQLDSSRFELTKILNDEPDHAVARFFLGLVRMKQQDWKGASEELAAGLRTRSGDAAGQNALALTELHLNSDTAVAVKRLKQLVAANPDYAPATYNLAVIYDQWLRDPGAALGWYKQYLQKAGENGEQAEAAKLAITRLSSMGPQAPVVAKQADREAAAKYAAQGTKLHEAKKYRDAVTQYELAVKADPSLVDAHYNLGLSYYELKQYRDAARACSDALKLNPGYADARYMLALSYARLGEWTNAEREATALKKVDTARGDVVLKYISDARKR